MTRAAWPREIRERAMQLVREGHNPTEAAELVGVPACTVWFWRNQARLGVGPAKPATATTRTKQAGSGVIAPAPYARGLLFPGGSGRRRGE